MPPNPAAIFGTRAPTAKNRVATAIPNWPVALSRAMIDQVISALSSHLTLSPCRVALHAARVGGGATAATDFRSGGETALRPVGTGLHDVTAALELIHSCPRHAGLDH